MEEFALISSDEDVMAVEPVIRRVVAARVANQSDVDDLVQDCLERLLGARGRLAPETVLPYGIVTARNLVASHARTAARRASVVPLLADLSEPERPEDMVLTGEAHGAMEAALSRLSAGERADILAYYDASPSPGTETTESTGALRVRMARIRAKLRLEYLLAFRRVDLPTERCYRVLLAVSAGDRRRQRELQAGQHLLQCATCAALAEPLSKRSAALTAIMFPVALLTRLKAAVKAHPAQAGTTAAAGTAAAATAAVIATRVLAAGPAPAVHHAATPTPTVRPSSTAPPAAITGLRIGGQTITTRHPIRAVVGQSADASDVMVEGTVTRNGFWIGSPSLHVWVELTGPLRPLKIVARDHVRFSGTVTANGSSFTVRAGVQDGPDAALLNRQGAHIDVETTHIEVVGHG